MCDVMLGRRAPCDMESAAENRKIPDLPESGLRVYSQSVIALTLTRRKSEVELKRLRGQKN